MDEQTRNKHIGILIYIAYIGIGVFVLKNYLPLALTLFMPFILAYIVAAITAPLANFLHDKLKLNKTFSSIFAWAICLVLLLTIFGLIVYKLTNEITSIAKESETYAKNIEIWVRGFSSRFVLWKGELAQGYINFL
ncbi:AI-2E family transporter, partial [Treponema sp. R6D11]